MGVTIMNKELTEIENRLLRYSVKDNFSTEIPIIRIGLSVPLVRKEGKKNFSFSKQPKDERLKLWDYVWRNTSYYEVMSLALYNYQGKSLSKNECQTLLGWISRCTCWEHSDDLSKIFAQIVEENPNCIIPTYKKWNRSNCPWKKRQSLVGLIEYASKRKKVLPFEELIRFVHPLLNDKEYYVQKGLGWTLREIYNVYPQQAIVYMENNLEFIQPIAYSAATEKIDKQLKKQMNEQRKRFRKQGE
jgi:3-methyladenine DNA glycosylase AlkD